MVKNLPGNAGNIRNTDSVSGLGRSPGGGHGNPLQYACLENPWTEEPGGLQWGHKELDMTEVTEHAHTYFNKVMLPFGIFKINLLRYITYALDINFKQSKQNYSEKSLLV